MTNRPTLDELTAQLPREIEPPADLWNDIRAALPPRASNAPPAFAWGGRRLAAAALLIAVGSSAITVFALRERSAAPSPVASSTPLAPAGGDAPVALPPRLASAEHDYARSIATLARTLDERRDSLAPSTVAIVERSLQVADSAIAEARVALARDPGNRALAALFASNYERKIDLLKRAAELSPRT